MRLRVVFPILPVLSLCAACHNGGTSTANGQLQVPSTLSFGDACVKAADPTLVVAPLTKNLSMQNVGVASLAIASITVDNAAFTLPATLPQTLIGGQTYPLPVSFLPTSAGAVSAHLTITLATGGSTVVTLSGNGSSVPSVPVVLLHCPGGRAGTDGGTADRCYDFVNQQTSPNPLLWFSDTVVGKSNDITVTVANQGCATLNVAVGDAGAPFAVLGADAGFTLAGAPSAPYASGTFQVHYQPTVSGVAQGNVTLTTNAASPNLSLSLLGLATAPSLQLCATVGTATDCSTAAIPATCDFSATPACTGAFAVQNSGGSPISVTSIALSQGNPQFALSSLPALPLALTATGSAGDHATFMVTYSPSTTFQSDLLVVQSTGGDLTAHIQAGQIPALVVLPAAGDLADTVDFNRDSTGAATALPNGYTGTKTFQIHNAGAGALTVSSVFFRDTGGTTWPAGAPYPYFSVNPPAANTVVQPNASTNVQVAFADAPNGGPSGGAGYSTSLEIDSNDPSFPPASGGKTVTVQAKTPCNPAPVAVVTGPTGFVDAGITVQLNGNSSYDIEPDSSGSCQPGLTCTASPAVSGCRSNPIRHWQWQLLDAGSPATLTPNGLTASGTTQLTLGNCSPCSYTVRLVVYDDTTGTTANPNGLPSTPYDFTVLAQ